MEKTKSHSMVAKFLSIPDTLQQLETILLNPRTIPDFKIVENMIAEDFIEFGASGKIYTKSQTVEILKDRTAIELPASFDISDFNCIKLNEEVYHITYTLFYGGILTRRSSLWKKFRDNWRLIFHQGTLVKE